MSLLRLHVHPDSPQSRSISRAAEIIADCGIGIYPTDTVYGMGTAVSCTKAIDRLAQILHKDKARLLSFICADLSMAAKYVHISNAQFKLLKRLLPGPYTFILPATSLVPRKLCPKRNEVGIRIPDCNTAIALVNALGEPLANASLDLPGPERGDVEMISLKHMHDTDVMLDIGDIYEPVGSTIVDLTGDEAVLVREGKGTWHE